MKTKNAQKNMQVQQHNAKKNTNARPNAGAKAQFAFFRSCSLPKFCNFFPKSSFCLHVSRFFVWHFFWLFPRLLHFFSEIMFVQLVPTRCKSSQGMQPPSAPPRAKASSSLPREFSRAALSPPVLPAMVPSLLWTWKLTGTDLSSGAGISTLGGKKLKLRPRTCFTNLAFNPP